MKKIYTKPVMDVVKIEVKQILAASGDTPMGLRGTYNEESAEDQ